MLTEERRPEFRTSNRLWHMVMKPQ